eukprot:487630-Pelagomonas_calceolata.AAC.3
MLVFKLQPSVFGNPHLLPHVLTLQHLQVYSWGWNDRGTLGHGHRAHERKPRRVQALAGKNIVQVSVRFFHTFTLLLITSAAQNTSLALPHGGI